MVEVKPNVDIVFEVPYRRTLQGSCFQSTVVSEKKSHLSGTKEGLFHVYQFPMTS